MRFSHFKNIIFDLGGVILDLSVAATVNAFAKVSGKSVEDIIPYFNSAEFLAYEKGLLSDEEFRNVIRKKLEIETEDKVIDQCWNAMLGGISYDRFTLLTNLKSTYRTFLLSNTNEIHLKCFGEIAKNCSGQRTLEEFFHKVYYSHQIKMRKPDREIFDYVLKENNLDPKETLFLDDNLLNLEGAAQTGIKTFHVEKPELIFFLANS